MDKKQIFFLHICNLINSKGAYSINSSLHSLLILFWLIEKIVAVARNSFLT